MPSKSRPSGSPLRWTVRNGVAWITLTRARIDQAAGQALCDACEALELDERVQLVVIQGRGRAFCLGVENGGAWEREHDWVEAVAHLTRPIVAALGGDALAEGCELALACDVRVAGADAYLALPQLVEGRFPRHGATQRLPRLIGRTRALDVLLSGRRIGAREAERIGLVTRVVPRAGFAAAVRAEVGALRRKGPIALRLGKEAVIKGMDLTLEQGIRLEQDLYVLLQTTADRAEGVRAFLERRRPRFRGE